MGPCLSKSGAEERALRPRQNRYDDLLTNYQQGPPGAAAATPAIGAPMRNPIASPQDIEQAGSRGTHNEAFGAYSWNGRNGYNEKEVYNLGVFVGKGAFGQVFKVSHKTSAGAEEFALKYARPVELIQRIPLDSYDDVTYRVGEIKALLLLRNVPNILQIREFFFNFRDPNGAPLALVTELMLGEDLDKWMKDRATMEAGVTELTASEVCLGLLNAVQHMHSRNIVHRDLKVSNMRITNPNDPSSVKVYDFGLARVLDEHTPQVNEDCGSLGYTAPELLKRQPYGVEVDMFSSGVIIFFILSGYRPFNVPGAGRPEVKSRIINCEYTFDLQRWSRVSAEAQSLVRGLLVPRDERLKAYDAVDHPWLQEDEATRFNLESHNLNQNATYIEVGVAEPAHSYHSAASTIAVHVDPGIQIILTQIRSDRIGSSHYSFTANEHVNAVPLVDYVAQSSEPYTERQCRLLFFKLFRAVETLHQRNVVHRSLRREHIYVQESNGNVRIVIAGMQNARIMENGNPLTGNCGTSLVATAPEVYRAIAYDSAVDMWALGVLFYEFMSGLFPFRGKGRMLREEIARAAVVFDDFYPGSQQSRDLILSLIQSDPRQRLTISEALQHEWFRTELIDNDLGLAQAMLSH